MKRILIVFLVFSVSVFADTADELLKLGEFNGGIILHVGSADGALSCALLKDERTMVYGLDKSAENVLKARALAYKKSVAGKVNFAEWNSKSLPFAANFVNLIICESDVAAKELERVLAPYGSALIKKGTRWERIYKAYPSTMDHWPQHFHSPDGNAVSKDKMVKPPLYHLQWTGSPRWSRHHDVMSSFSACVSAGGRLFYVFDEGTTYTPFMPTKWKLIARDAFNGTILWKVDIPKWFPNMHSLKSGPSHLPRRVVATEDRVYATLSIEGPVTVIDAKSGKIIEDIKGSEGTEEIVMEKDALFLVSDRAKDKKELSRYPYSSGVVFHKRPKNIIKVDTKTNKVVWEYKAVWSAPLSLCTDTEKAYFFNGESVVALDKMKGERKWLSPKLPFKAVASTNYGPSLVTYKNRVLFTGAENYKAHQGSRGKLTALAAEDGKIVWQSNSPASGYQSPENMFVINGMVWQSDTTAMSWNTQKDKSGKPFAATGVTSATGLEQGKEKLSFAPTEDAYWFHHRCYPAKATEDYMILSRTGVEFVDIKTKKWTLHHWVRGACLFGILPANGLVYAPPHPCACYIGAKLYGFTALAGMNPDNPIWKKTKEETRLKTYKQDLAYSESKDLESWPVYRQNNRRSGTIKTALPDISKEQWRINLGGELTPPVIADGKVVVVQKDKHTVNTLDADTAKILWRFTAGGPIDSPPTLYKGRCYFGSADGYIYCLDLKTGEQIWRFQGAPTKAKHMYFENIESTHPLHGSVLINDDKIYAVAGRSMFIDGGMSFLILDAKTGKKLKEINMNDKVPGTDKQLQLQHEVLSMPQALNDILSCDGKQIHMRLQDFDLEGNRLELKFSGQKYGKAKSELGEIFKKVEDQSGEGAHIISGTGYLDDSWWHRTYWSYGKNYTSGWSGYYQAGKQAPSGRIISFDDGGIFSFGRMTQYYKWSKVYEYYLFNRSYDNKEKWGVRIPLLVRSMLLSSDTLYALGPEEIMNQKSTFKTLHLVDTQKLAQDQDEHFHGKRGATLLLVDRTNGKMTKAYKLHTTPVFDGMAAAYKKLFVSMTDGSLICLANSGKALTVLPESKINEYNNNAKIIPPKPKKKRKKKPIKK